MSASPAGSIPTALIGKTRVPRAAKLLRHWLPHPERNAFRGGGESGPGLRARRAKSRQTDTHRRRNLQTTRSFLKRTARHNPQVREDPQTKTANILFRGASFRWPQDPVNRIGEVGGDKIRLKLPLWGVPEIFAFTVTSAHQDTARPRATGKLNVGVAIADDEGAMQIDGMLLGCSLEHA